VIEQNKVKEMSEEEKLKVLKLAKDFLEEVTIEEESKNI